MSGYLYFIHADTGDDEGGFWKIGYTSKHPERRAAQLQTGCPFRLELMGFIPASNADERMIHSQLRGKNVIGEWYRFPDEIGGIFIRSCDFYGKILRGEIAR